MADKPLGRKIPTDWKHIQKYPMRAVMAADVTKVEKILKLPYWHWQHDQGSEGACVGFGSSMMMSIMNESQARLAKLPPYVHLYNARWLWNEAKKIDEWDDTNPGDNEGTSVRAAMDVLRTLGHVRVVRKLDKPADISQGIKENRWATKIDEMRAAIAEGKPVSIGVYWYANFDNPKPKGKEFIIGEGDLGLIRGGHCVCVYGASDKRQAFKIKNSWGKDYPLVWMPYETMERLLREDGEATLITDI